MSDLSDKTMAELMQSPAFAAVWSTLPLPPDRPALRHAVELLACVAYTVGRADATETALAVISRPGTPKEPTP